MKIKKVLCVFLGLLLLLCSVPAMAGAVAIDTSMTESSISHYEYPITSDSPDWFDYTVHEKVEMLRIPEDTLARMTDAALVQAIVDYPYLVDLYVYGDIYDGIRRSSRYFSALKELLARDTGVEALQNYLSGGAVALSANVTTHQKFVSIALPDLFDAISGNPTVHTAADYYVTTPNGSRVSCSLGNEEHTALDHNAMDQELLLQYDITLLYPGTCRFNCHSYAWYSRSWTNNNYWVELPTPYMTDGSYSRVYGGSPSSVTVGSSGIVNQDIIYYDGNTHSAYYVGGSGSGASSQLLTNALCRSKWEEYGVFEHALSEVPDDYWFDYVSVWHR